MQLSRSGSTTTVQGNNSPARAPTGNAGACGEMGVKTVIIVQTLFGARPTGSAPVTPQLNVIDDRVTLWYQLIAENFHRRNVRLKINLATSRLAATAHHLCTPTVLCRCFCVQKPPRRHYTTANVVVLVIQGDVDFVAFIVGYVITGSN